MEEADQEASPNPPVAAVLCPYRHPPARQLSQAAQGRAEKRLKWRKQPMDR